MSIPGAPPPIACNPCAFTTRQRTEFSRLAERGAAAVVAARELPDGYSFQLDLPLVAIARWIDLWRRCCPFYEFRLDVRGADGASVLTLHGRPGVKEYFPIEAPAALTRRIAACLRNQDDPV